MWISPQTSGRILSLYYQVGTEVCMGGIQEVYSEKGTLDSHERILANSYHKRRPVVRMFPVLRLWLLPLLSSQKRRMMSKQVYSLSIKAI